MFCVNKLALNANKANFLLFTPKSIASVCQTVLYFYVHTVSCVDTVRYQGLNVGCNFTWKTQIQSVNDKINKRLAGLLHVLNLRLLCVCCNYTMHLYILK